MYERRLLELAERFPGPKKQFFALRKKDGREIYFSNDSKAFDFMKIKFLSSVKKTVHTLIKLRLLQPFLPKVMLPEAFGQVIFVGGQIKCFDLEKRQVLSFRLTMNHDNFVKSKKEQQRAAKMGFAPIITSFDQKNDIVQEELLDHYLGGDNEGVFKRLLSFYRKQKTRTLTLKQYLTFLESSLKKRKDLDMAPVNDMITRIKELYKPTAKIMLTKVHGDFTEEQILIKNNKYLFTDWCGYEGVIIRDLVKFFRDEPNLLKNHEFRKLTKLYPKQVQEKVRLYVALNELFSLLRREELTPNFITDRLDQIKGALL